MSVTSEARPAARPPLARPAISVALCTFNGGPWIETFLDSLAAQRLLPDELVVQDDGSTDDTVAIVEGFAAAAPFEVRLEVNEHQLGSTANFERVLKRTTGRYIALADQDDIWFPEKLERLVQVLEDDPILTLVFSDAHLLDPDGRPTGRRLWADRGIHRMLTAHEVVPGPQFARRSLTTGCTMVARRRAVDAALPFPASLDDLVAPMRHDRWLSLVAAAVGTVRAVPEPLLGFRVHPQQQTGVLAPTELRRRLVGVALNTIRRPSTDRSYEHQARAAQIAEAAQRADRLGDFEEADELRRVVRHHLARADLGSTRPQRLRTVWTEAKTAGYDRSSLGAAAAAADVVRAVRVRSEPHR